MSVVDIIKHLFLFVKMYLSDVRVKQSVKSFEFFFFLNGISLTQMVNILKNQTTYFYCRSFF